MEDQRRKQVETFNITPQSKSIKDLFPKHLLNTEAKDEAYESKTIEQEITRDHFIHKTGNKRG